MLNLLLLLFFNNLLFHLLDDIFRDVLRWVADVGLRAWLLFLFIGRRHFLILLLWLIRNVDRRRDGRFLLIVVLILISFFVRFGVDLHLVWASRRHGLLRLAASESLRVWQRLLDLARRHERADPVQLGVTILRRDERPLQAVVEVPLMLDLIIVHDSEFEQALTFVKDFLNGLALLRVALVLRLALDLGIFIRRVSERLLEVFVGSSLADQQVELHVLDLVGVNLTDEFLERRLK